MSSEHLPLSWVIGYLGWPRSGDFNISGETDRSHPKANTTETNQKKLGGCSQTPYSYWGREENYLDQEAEGVWVRSKLQGFAENICMGTCLTEGPGGMIPIKVKVLRTKRE